MRSSKPSSFWAKALLASAVLLIPAAWLELRLRAMDGLYQQKRAGLEAQAATAQVLILGASQANQGLDPSHWPVPAYNAACVAQDAYYDAELFKAWQPRMPALRAVVVAMSYVNLDATLADTPETWRCFAYRQAFGIANEMPEARWDLRNWSALALREPWEALKLAQRGFRELDPVPLNAQGFQTVPALPEESLDLMLNGLTAAKRLSYHDSIRRPGRAEQSLARYGGMLRQAKEHGIQVFLVVFPVDATYAALVPAEALKIRRERLQGLAAGGGVTVLDYFTDRRFQSADFADVDHMSVKGAEKFSPILWDEGLKRAFKR